MNTSPPPETYRPAFAYDGTLRELYAIFLPNLVLTLLTLGIYRFWAIARLRRHIWSRVSFDGERFEYTGTGGEMFRGFLFAGAILLAVQLVVAAIRAWNPQIDQGVQSLIGLLYIYLGQAAIFAAQRYRLSRTRWRGIRGGAEGSAFAYGAAAMGRWALVSVTLGLVSPWAILANARARRRAVRFGDLACACDARSGAVYVVFLVSILVAVAVMAGTWLAIRLIADQAGFGELSFNDPHMRTIGRPLVIAAVVVLLLALPLLMAWFSASLDREIDSKTTLGTLRFRNSITGPMQFGLTLGNMLIIICTLGLGFPIALHRRLRLLARTVSVAGEIDATRLHQNTLAVPRTGEGLFQQLDGGAVF